MRDNILVSGASAIPNGFQITKSAVSKGDSRQHDHGRPHRRFLQQCTPNHKRIVFCYKLFNLQTRALSRPLRKVRGKKIAQRWLVSITTHVHAVQSYDVYKTREVINHKKRASKSLQSFMEAMSSAGLINIPLHRVSREKVEQRFNRLLSVCIWAMHGFSLDVRSSWFCAARPVCVSGEAARQHRSEPPRICKRPRDASRHLPAGWA